MRIPSRNYLVTKRGVAVRGVQCESCRTNFVYLLSRETAGHGTSVLFLDNTGAEQRATDQAVHELQKQLKDDIDPVPCPKCGRYQAEMIPVIRRGLYWWMYGAAAICFLAGFISLLMVPFVLLNARQASGASVRVGALALGGFMGAFGGFALLFVRKQRCRAYDPNAQDRKTLARSSRHRTMLKEEFDRDGAERLMDPIAEKNARSDWRERQFYFFMAFAFSLFLIGLGATFLVFLREEITDGLSSTIWPKAIGIVEYRFVDTKATKEDGTFVYSYLPVVTYKYEVDGVEYTGSRYRFEPVKSRNFDEINSLIAPFPQGQQIQVHYKPSRPDVSVLIPGLQAGRIVLIVGLVVALVVGLGLGAYVVNLYRKARRQRRAAI